MNKKAFFNLVSLLITLLIIAFLSMKILKTYFKSENNTVSQAPAQSVLDNAKSQVEQINKDTLRREKQQQDYGL